MFRTDGDEIFVMGLNNYSQLALPTTKGLSFFMPYHSKEMTPHSWSTVAIGQHHAICLEQEGGVWALGRQEYGECCLLVGQLILILSSYWSGRLGLGEGGQDATVPTRVSSDWLIK